MDELGISYLREDEWTGNHHSRCCRAIFGEASAWIDPDEISDFATALERFPMPSNQPAKIECGLGGTLDGRIPPQRLFA